MSVRAILKDKGTEIISVAPDDSIKSASELLAAKRIGAVIVRGGDGAIAGVLSERDIVRGVAEQGELCLKMKVSQLMTASVVTCTPEDSVAGIMGKLTDRRIRHLPVVDNGELVGVISIGDVVKYRIAEAEKEAMALRDYITSG